MYLYKDDIEVEIKKMSLEDKLGSTPFFELAIRKLWYSDSNLIKAIKLKMKSQEKSKKENTNIEHKDEVLDAIKNLKISKGDILIVHSSVPSHS